jgi:L-amino acid N-acyltransferase YncA
VTPLRIGPLLPEHWPEVQRIHLEGIATGHATFATEPEPWAVWDASHLDTPRLVAVAEGKTVGWCALSPVSSRCVYAGVAEVSVYVAQNQRGMGIGRALMEALIEGSEARGIWTLQSGIFPENAPSLALHEAVGFVVVGRRQKLGQMAGVWRDILLLERRSGVVGVQGDPS